jgi:hypothetical protein
MTKPTVVRVTPEEAVPFIRAYNSLMHTNAVNECQAGEAIWCGISVKDTLRAVLGLQALDHDEVWVWGMFGDGSGTVEEALAGAHLSKIVAALPFELSGAILPKNTAQLRRAERAGWHDSGVRCYTGWDEELQQIWKRGKP